MAKNLDLLLLHRKWSRTMVQWDRIEFLKEGLITEFLCGGSILYSCGRWGAVGIFRQVMRMIFHRFNHIMHQMKAATKESKSPCKTKAEPIPGQYRLLMTMCLSAGLCVWGTNFPRNACLLSD